MRCDALSHQANTAKVAALHAVLATYRAAALPPLVNYSGSSRLKQTRKDA
jgi:hypothetical protein